MARVHSSYRAPAWLPGGHLQTIVPALFAPRPQVPYRRERWETPDQDFIDADFAQPEPADESAPIVVLFHGLEGSSRSHYALSVMAEATRRHWRALVIHFRGCSGEPNRLARAYHSGDTQEGLWVLRRLQQRFPDAPLHAVGVSLGGNMVAKLLGEMGTEADFLKAAVCIGAPLDLAAGGEALARGVNMIYTKMFLSTMKTKALDKARRFPGTLNVERLRASRNLFDFDNEFTAPVHGFNGATDYWSRASAKPVLGGIAIPTLLLNARNDPFVPLESLPGEKDVSSHVTLEQPMTGGHIGFAQGAPPGRIDFIAQRAFDFFERGQ